MIVGAYLKNNILLLGGSGTLGKSLIRSKLFKNLNYPSSKVLDILNQKKIEKFLVKKKINTVFHFAALARVKECQNDKKKAYRINVIGTQNVVKAVSNCLKKNNLNIKTIFMSSDAVYSPIKGNHKENDKLKPYNYYGWTKLQGEKAIIKLKDFIIIRTRFFDKKKIKFNYAAINIFTSAIEVNMLVKYINKILKKKFNGILNIGGKRISDFHKYKRFKKSIKPCDKSKIFNKLNFKLATDASMNIKKLKRLI